MITITDKKLCCGCTACQQTCHKQCITMQRDGEGFLYPVADSSLCVECGLCEKVCPALHPFTAKEPREVLAAINRDEAVRAASSSGGIFTLLAERTLAAGGVVFGAQFDDDWQVVIDYATTSDGVAAFRGSKYLQARVGNSYADCRRFLDEGRQVLYSGAPCQVSGLLHFLRKPYDNLLAVDFICHGVPSPGVWADYLKEVSEAGRRAISDISFRDKEDGWRRFGFRLDYREGEHSAQLTASHTRNAYFRAFLSDMILRPSCSHCPAKGGTSGSDITIADFWGIQSVAPEMDDDRGTSLVIVNSERGTTALPTELMRTKRVGAVALQHNSAYRTSASAHRNREAFFEAYAQAPESITDLFERMLRPTKKQRVKNFILLPLRAFRSLRYRLKKSLLKRNQWGVTIANSISYKPVLRTGHPVAAVNFRNKKHGWKGYVFTIDINR